MPFRRTNNRRAWTRCSGLLAFAGAATVAMSATTTIGPTYPIAEPDMLSVIKDRAAHVDMKRYWNAHPNHFAKLESVNVPRASRTQVRTFDPTYAIPADILDQHGKVLFPAGTKVNALTKVQLPGRYIVIAPQDYDWLRTVGKPGPHDHVLVANANAIDERLRTHWPLYQLTQRFVDRFGVQAVPCVIQQRGTLLQINEYEVSAHG